MVEQRTENPCVGSSILPLGTEDSQQPTINNQLMACFLGDCKLSVIGYLLYVRSWGSVAQR